MPTSLTGIAPLTSVRTWICTMLTLEISTVAGSDSSSTLAKVAVDDDCNQTGQMLATSLNLLQGTFTPKVIIDKNQFMAKEPTVEREVDGGTKTICSDLPALIMDRT